MKLGNFPDSNRLRFANCDFLRRDLSSTRNFRLINDVGRWQLLFLSLPPPSSSSASTAKSDNNFFPIEFTFLVSFPMFIRWDPFRPMKTTRLMTVVGRR